MLHLTLPPSSSSSISRGAAAAAAVLATLTSAGRTTSCERRPPSFPPPPPTPPLAPPTDDDNLHCLLPPFCGGGGGDYSGGRSLGCILNDQQKHALSASPSVATLHSTASTVVCSEPPWSTCRPLGNMRICLLVLGGLRLLPSSAPART